MQFPHSLGEESVPIRVICWRKFPKKTLLLRLKTNHFYSICYKSTP